MVENQQSLARKLKIELSTIQLNCPRVYSRMNQNQNTISISAYPCLLALCSQETELSSVWMPSVESEWMQSTWNTNIEVVFSHKKGEIVFFEQKRM